MKDNNLLINSKIRMYFIVNDFKKISIIIE